jgi:uncharacterized spore protein YtfJ
MSDLQRTEDQAEVIRRIIADAAADRVFGEPVTRGDITVLPVAKVMSGAGGGSGRGPQTSEAGGESGLGGGYGVVARPVGAFVITGTTVRWRSAVDLTRLALIAAGAVVLVARALRPR